MTVAAVVPTLDEEARIAATLDALRLAGIDEIVVADGRSRDATVQIARERGAQVVAAPRGRARQLNAGAAAAGAETLAFVHADVLVPPDAAAWIRETLATPGVVAGAFRSYTLHDGAGPPTRLAPWLRLADVRSRFGRVAYGDQAIFLRRAMFEELRRLRRRGTMPTVPREVLVSGRRFVAHPLWATLCCHTFPLLHDMGVSPARQARLWTVVR